MSLNITDGYLMSAQYKSALENFAQGIAETIAIRADELGIGVDGAVTEYENWADRLHEAVDDGLEAAERRAQGLDL